MKKILLLSLMLSILMNCLIDEAPSPSEVRIRISNVSEYNFIKIMVNASAGDVMFEDISPGDVTEYKVYEKAYRYAFVELEAGEATCRLQPIDYVGETPLKPGNYTYSINADVQDQNCALTLSVIED